MSMRVMHYTFKCVISDIGHSQATEKADRKPKNFTQKLSINSTQLYSVNQI